MAPSSSVSAIRVSLIVGIVLFGIKAVAYYFTQSTGVLSDTAESLVHIFAVAFALFSAHYAQLPADEDHPYGHDRIAFFSSGIEGTLLFVTGALICIESVHNLMKGSEVQDPSMGILLTSFCILINVALGAWLLRQAKKSHSLIVKTNGVHIFSDALISTGVVTGLYLTRLTGHVEWDSIAAFVISWMLLVAGLKVLRKSFNGLMDRSSPSLLARIGNWLSEFCVKYHGTSAHEIRVRDSGEQLHIEFHFITPDSWSVKHAHDVATEAERFLAEKLKRPSKILSHLEPESDAD